MDGKDGMKRGLLFWRGGDHSRQVKGERAPRVFGSLAPHHGLIKAKQNPTLRLLYSIIIGNNPFFLSTNSIPQNT